MLPLDAMPPLARVDVRANIKDGVLKSPFSSKGRRHQREVGAFLAAIPIHFTAARDPVAATIAWPLTLPSNDQPLWSVVTFSAVDHEAAN
jgi:hypothetical protein